uniref:Secreted protein n=1 Tax=Poecilia latipinna TaxID=48699 RepID=A0A3B3UA27_9TELE
MVQTQKIWAVWSILISARFFAAAVRHHEAGDPQCPSEAEAPNKHFMRRLSVLADVLENRLAALLLRSGRPTECCVATHTQGRLHMARAETWESHPEETSRGPQILKMFKSNSNQHSDVRHI